MRQLTLSTVCMIAALATAPAFAGPDGRTGKRSPTAEPECTHTSPADSRGTAQGRASPRSKEMDCMVVMGYPSQDGRATLRRSLEKEAKKGLSRVIRSGLKDLSIKKPTS